MQNRHSWFLWCLIFKYFFDILQSVFTLEFVSFKKICSIRRRLLSFVRVVSLFVYQGRANKFFNIGWRQTKKKSRRLNSSKHNTQALAMVRSRFMMNRLHSVFSTFELRETSAEWNEIEKWFHWQRVINFFLVVVWKTNVLIWIHVLWCCRAEMKISCDTHVNLSLVAIYILCSKIYDIENISLCSTLRPTRVIYALRQRSN